MFPPEVISCSWSGPVNTPESQRVLVRVDRHTLAKRRWRAVAEDGRDFGFALEQPLQDGQIFLVDADVVYAIEQLPEPVIEVPFHAPADAAWIAWSIGNLHFPLEILNDRLIAPDDPAIRQLIDRERIESVPAIRVFHPVGAGAHEPHGHSTH